MRLSPFSPEHLRALPESAVKWMAPEIALAASAYFSFSGFDDRGRLVGCAGIAPEAETSRLVAWAAFSPLIAMHAKSVLRAVKVGLDLHRGERVCAYIEEDHAKAARFAEAVHFRVTDKIAPPHPDGVRFHVYARGDG